MRIALCAITYFSFGDITSPNTCIRTEETLIGLLSTGRPAVIEVCYRGGSVMRDFWGISHWITVNGFFLVGNSYWFRYSDPVTVSYTGISSELLEESSRNVVYIDLPYTPDRYIGAFSDPLLSIASVTF